MELEEKLEQLPWLNDRIILLTHTGSKAYGTFVEGKSDIDYKGVCIPPEEYYLGLDRFDNFDSTGGKNFKTKEGQVDVTVIHISKFVRDALVGVPNNLEILFTDPQDILRVNDFGRELITHRQDFLSKAIKHKFGGYAHSQVKKLQIKNSNGTGRQDLIEKFKYDTKFASHAVRLLTAAIEILTTGTFTTKRPNAKELLAIRNGKYTEDEIMKIILDLDVELEELYTKTNKVPHTPDYSKINKWLVDLNKRAITTTWEG